MHSLSNIFLPNCFFRKRQRAGHQQQHQWQGWQQWQWQLQICSQGRGQSRHTPKEVRPKAAVKKPTTTTEMTLPAPRPLSNFSIDSTNKFAIAYYCEGTQDLLTWSSTSMESWMWASTAWASLKMECPSRGSAPSSLCAKPRRSWLQLWGMPTPPPTIASLPMITLPRRCLPRKSDPTIHLFGEQRGWCASSGNARALPQFSCATTRLITMRLIWMGGGIASKKW